MAGNVREFIMSYYEKHIFFCTNQKDNDKKCCQQANATELLNYAKKRIAELGLSVNKQIRMNKAGCLGRCEEGPSIVIYPEGVWYTYANQNDIDEIIQTHLIDQKIVDRLLMQTNTTDI